MNELRDRGPIPTHPAVLNLMLLACPSGRLKDWAETTYGTIHELRGRYSRPAQVEWLPGLPIDDWNDLEAYYNPRTFACLGPFDLATLYLSPAISQPFPPIDRFLGAGQHVHLALLPELSSWLNDDDDFNDDFIKCYSEDTKSELPFEQRFLAIIKLKTNAPATWPTDRRGDRLERFTNVVGGAAQRVASWRRRLDVPPQVALGLGVGWSELVIVAQAYAIAPLFELIWALRRQTSCVAWEPDKRAHTFATSLSHIGFDHKILLEVRKQLVSTVRDEEGSRASPAPTRYRRPSWHRSRRTYGVGSSPWEVITRRRRST